MLTVKSDIYSHRSSMLQSFFSFEPAPITLHDQDGTTLFMKEPDWLKVTNKSDVIKALVKDVLMSEHLPVVDLSEISSGGWPLEGTIGTDYLLLLLELEIPAEFIFDPVIELYREAFNALGGSFFKSTGDARYRCSEAFFQECVCVFNQLLEEIYKRKDNPEVQCFLDVTEVVPEYYPWNILTRTCSQ